MPVITIKSHKLAKKLELEKIAKDISCQTGIETARIKIMAEYYDPEDFFSGTIEELPIIHIEVAEKNGKEFIHNLMKVCKSTVAKHLNRMDNNIGVYAHPIGEGYLLVKDMFM